MIPAAFDYHAPTTVEEALRLLAESGDDVKVLAGGQSLLPVLKLRLAAPEVVVDLGRIDALRGVREDGDALVIGAMTPHFEVAADALVEQHALLLREATRTVADPQVRHRIDALELVDDLIVAGRGIGLLPRGRASRRGVRVLRLTDPPVTMRTYAVVRRGRDRWSPLRVALEALRSSSS